MCEAGCEAQGSDVPSEARSKLLQYFLSMNKVRSKRSKLVRLYIKKCPMANKKYLFFSYSDLHCMTVWRLLPSSKKVSFPTK